jgi:hypothetical protein
MAVVPFVRREFDHKHADIQIRITEIDHELTEMLWFADCLSDEENTRREALIIERRFLLQHGTRT